MAPCYYVRSNFQIYQVHQAVARITVGESKFSEMCARVPIGDIFQAKKRRKRQITTATEDDDYDFWAGEYDEYSDYYETSIVHERINFRKYGRKRNDSDNEDILDDIPDNIYCDLVETLNEKCIESSLLEIWKYDEELVKTASQQEILDSVNLLLRSPWYGFDVDYPGMLGGISRNTSGHIIGAKSLRMVWVIKVPKEGRIDAAQGSGVDLEVADLKSLEWEEQLINITLSSSTNDMKVRVNAAKSFGDISSEAIFFDAALMAGGYMIMFIYTIIMLGRLNKVEVRFYLTISGIIGIGMGLVIAIGLSALIGYPYTPIHAILPFLCLGIGIDDMFVISQCWSNIQSDPLHKDIELSERIGKALKHAGVSITVTSLTDVFAFGVGAVTVSFHTICTNLYPAGQLISQTLSHCPFKD